jgi:hypothetical protein
MLRVCCERCCRLLGASWFSTGLAVCMFRLRCRATSRQVTLPLACGSVLP